MKASNSAKLFALILAAAGTSIVSAQSVETQALEDFHGADLRGKDGPLNKIGFDLSLLAREHQQHVAENARRGESKPFTPADAQLQIQGDKVVIDAVAYGDVQALRAQLEALGMTNTAVAGKYVSGLLPIDSLPEAAALPSLAFANPARAMTFAGQVATQGDTSLNSDMVRTMHGVDGTGIRVGALSDSYNNNIGTPRTYAADDVATGDLPNDVLVVNDTIKGSDEGRAMLQIVHDIAPGADLAFHTAFGGVANFANGIRALADAGCNVIVDDVLYYTEPMFQDGLVTLAIDDVVSRGVSYFTAAGNGARQSYESPFRNSAVAGPISGGALHDFDPGPGVDTAQQITVPVGTTINFVLQWDQPFSSLGGAFCKTDVDFFVTDMAGNVKAAATAANINRDPVELLNFTNNGTIDVDGVPGPDTKFNLGIELYSGTQPGLMKYIFYKQGGSVVINDFPTNSGTIMGHMLAEGAETVGAAFYYYTPKYGYSTPVLEGFSSSGGTNILFNISGTRLAEPSVRLKPEIVAPDGGNNTSFGSDIADIGGTDTDTFPNFFGTSAAAPHAAGVAALILQATPYLTPGFLYQYMENGAISLAPQNGAATLSGETFNYNSGYGLVDASNSFPAPLLVTLVEFTAAAANDQSPVEIRWITSSEIDNVGFNVYRAIPNGPGSWSRGEKINATLIASQGSETAGATYAVVDDLPIAGDSHRAYFLEDIDLQGNATLHGPVQPRIDGGVRAAVEDWQQFEF